MDYIVLISDLLSSRGLVWRVVSSEAGVGAAWIRGAVRAARTIGSFMVIVPGMEDKLNECSKKCRQRVPWKEASFYLFFLDT